MLLSAPPFVVRALLNRSLCEVVSRMAADKLTTLHLLAYCGARVEAVGMLVDQMRSDAVLGRVIRLSRLGKGAVDDSEATTLEGRGAVGRGKIQQPSQRQRGRGELWRPYLAAGGEGGGAFAD